MSFWNQQVFEYCERAGNGAFWAEPFNAITNAAFWIAAFMALTLWLKMPAHERRRVDLALIVLVFVIGAGSFLFHTLATRWAAVADTAPIGIFMVAYLAYALRRYIGFNWLVTGVGLVLFFLALQQSSMLRCDGEPCLNGSLAYGPAFLVLVVIGGWLALQGHAAGRYLAAAGLIFALSLTFRTIDNAICPSTQVAGHPVGTHFLWHIFNATLLYLLLRAAVLHGGRRVASLTGP